MEHTKLAEQLINSLKGYIDGTEISVEEVNQLLYEYAESAPFEKQKNARYLAIEGIKLLKNAVEHPYFYYIYSYLIYNTGYSELYNSMIGCCIDDANLSKENQYYLYWQLTEYGFIYPHMITKTGKTLMNTFYGQIYDAYYKESQDMFQFIPKQERNKDFIIVITSQFLELEHAPTKTVLDRCYVLAKQLQKKVFILNTAEFMSDANSVPYYYIAAPSYKEEYSEWNSFVYKDEEFMFYQCPRVMPQMDVIKEIVSVVQIEKPYFIVNVGGNSIVSDLCSNIVPTLTLSTVFSGRACTRGQFQAIGRPMNEDDRQWLAECKLPEDHLISSLFTFAFKEQEHHYSRQFLGLPQDGFVVLLVGGRLDSEISDELEMFMEQMMRQGIYFAFAGNYSRYDEVKIEKPIYAQMGINLGFQEDILAVDECCNLCLNPKRVGGGSSVAEALYKGIPVVTFNYGDGGLAAGENFWVADYEAMGRMILKYRDDQSFYIQQSEFAKERGRQLTNSEEEFTKIIEKMEASPRF